MRSSGSTTWLRHLTALHLLSAVLVGATLLCFYATLATYQGDGWWPRGSCGAIFNAQAIALLNGKMALEPDVLGAEAFFRDGRFYTYFGIWPALLRIPLVFFLDRDWTALSCALAAAISTAFLLLTLRTAARDGHRSWTLRILLLATAISFIASGPQFELTAKPTVYVEAILWGYAFACIFIWLAFPVVLGHAVTPGRLTALAALAALALQARVTTGISLYAACSLMTIAAVVQSSNAGTAVLGRVLVPCILPLALGVLVAGSVNYARWGNPLEFANLARNVFYANDEARSHRLRVYGAFEADRFPHALKYYFNPSGFFDQRRAERGNGKITRLFDKAEGPAASQFTNKLAWWLLGLVALIKVKDRAGADRNGRLAALALPLGLTLAPVIISCYGYLAFRFGAEFAPFAATTALVGVSVASRHVARQGRRRPLALLALTLVAATATQLSSTWSNAAAYVASDYTDGACD
jgi:hypothetical protein